MSKSRLNEKVYYPEIKDLDEEDKNIDANLYEIQIENVDVFIAIGEAKYTFIEEGIVYYPVYIIKNDLVDKQIGVFEVLANKVPYILDDDGDVDVYELGEILLYSYVTPSVLKDSVEVKSEENINFKKPDSEIEEVELDTLDNNLSEEDSEEEEEEEEEDSKEEDSKEEEEDTEFSKIDERKQDEEERKNYKQTKSSNWIEKYMHNNNYKIVENEGGGDCLFASIRDGLNKGGVSKSVEEMRELLAEEATEDIFEGYLNVYTSIINELAMLKSDIKTNGDNLKELKQQIKQTKDREVLFELTDRAKQIQLERDNTKKEYATAKNLSTEYAFMDGIDTLDKFKNIIKTCDFWGETWAISTLERVLNVKLILFSEEAYKDGDLDNVILCGQLNDEKLQDKGEFMPTYYVMLEYIGNHYRLITYKNKGALKFKELPYNLKKKIVSKCLEKAAGPFYIIPDFKKFMDDMNVDVELEPDYSAEIEQIGLFNPSTVFQFYSQSSNSPLPGKGSGEKINDKNKVSYNNLASIPEWRRKLSNFWIQPFKLDKHVWNSVEHYYQASKFKENNPEFYVMFAADSNSGELSKDPAMAKAAGSKSGKYKDQQIRDKKIKIDPDFFTGKQREKMKEAQMAKFKQNEDLLNVLLATNDAKLQHYVRGKQPEVFTELMEVRKELKNK